jgi:hypothetical protein
MKERNYLSHHTPEGKTVNDMRSDYSIKSSISENLASHSKGSAFATIGLEYSPTHRMTLLNSNLKYIGVYSEDLENGDALLVEIFQDIPISISDLEQGDKNLKMYIKKKFPDLNISDERLKNISMEWSKIMSEKNEAKTDFGFGNDWKSILDKHNISKSSGIFVLSHASPQKMKEYFNKNQNVLENFFKNKKTYNMSLEMSSDGIVYLCIIASE